MTTPLLPSCESLTVEFKSDRKRLRDNDLVEAITCVANAQGGELWLGVEDDGTPTGYCISEGGGASRIVVARTSPSPSVTVAPIALAGVTVAR